MSQHVARLSALPLAFVAALLVTVLLPIYRVTVFVFALLLAAAVVSYRNAMRAFSNVAESIARPRV